MQGNCTSEPSSIAFGLTGAPFIDRRPGQCLIVTDVRLFSSKQDIWIDSLYLRYHSTSRSLSDAAEDLIWCSTASCNLWMTSITLQGDGITDTKYGGMQAVGGNVYADGVPPSSP